MSGVGTFGAYLNARVRAMKSALFSRARVEDLLDQNDLGLLIDVLLNSPYQKEMAEALTRYRGAEAIEEALSQNMVSTCQKLLDIVQGPFEFPARLFFLRWDLAAVKALLRRCHAGAGGQAPWLLPGPTLRGATLHALAERTSMESLIQGLVTWNPLLCAPLAGGLAVYRETRDLARLEETLDRTYFVETVRGLAASRDINHRLVRAAVQMEIDRTNLRTVFRLRAEGADLQSVTARLLPEGTLSLSLLRRMAAAGRAEESIGFLSRTPYKGLVAGLYPFLQSGRFSHLERQIDSVVVRELTRLARAHMFSLAILMLYVWLKYDEVVRIRLIAWGQVGRVPLGRLKEEMGYA